MQTLSTLQGNGIIVNNVSNYQAPVVAADAITYTQFIAVPCINTTVPPSVINDPQVDCISLMLVGCSYLHLFSASESFVCS
jgi:hypothetical protein